MDLATETPEVVAREMMTQLNIGEAPGTLHDIIDQIERANRRRLDE